MPISLILTPFDHFQIRLTFAVTPNPILEPCHMQFEYIQVLDIFCQQLGDMYQLEDVRARFSRRV